MATVYQYRILCQTDGYQYVWLADTDPAPTECPINAAHVVDDVTVTQTVSDTDVTITGSSVDLATTKKGFHDLTGHNVHRSGPFLYDIQAGVHNIFHEKFSVGMWLEGGGSKLPEFMFVSGTKVEYKPEKGDYLTFDMVDIDGVLPLGQAKNADISKVSRSSNVATVTTDAAHSFVVGDVVCINVDDDSFDDMEEAIASVPSSTTFTYANTGDDVAEKDATGEVGLIVFLGEFVPKGHVAPGENWSCIKDDAKYIPAGVYLRFRYVSLGSTDLVVMPFYSMRT